MKPATFILFALLVAGCGGKKNAAPSCEAVAKRLVELDAGDKASFMTDKERTSRAQRWMANCEPMSEATRRCVLAATTMEQADACREGGSAAPATAAATAKAAWIVRGGDASDQDAQFVVLMTDGDVVAAGDLEGVLELGGQTVTAQRSDVWVARLSPTGTVRWVKRFGGTGQDYVNGLSLGADGHVVIAVRADDEPHFSLVTLAADGTPTPRAIKSEYFVGAAALHANGDVVVGSRVTEPIKGGTCATRGFALQRFASDGKRLWSRCTDAKEVESFTDNAMHVAAGPDGTTAVCGTFIGPLAWAGNAAPEPGSDMERAFVMVVDAKGEPRWVNYAATERGAVCDAVAVTDDGSVVGTMLATSQGHELTLWSPDGTHRWTRSCSELLGEKKCQLGAVTARGDDVVVTGQLDAHTVITTVDGKTGANLKTSKFDNVTRITGLAARANELVFATGFSGAANFGTGPIESTEGSDGSSMDVLIGRIP